MFKDDQLKLTEDIEQAIQEGPTFGQSLFQTMQFNINQHRDDARSYRQVLLELNQKYVALKKSNIGARKLSIQIEQLGNKIRSEKDDLERALLECDKEEKEFDLAQQEKLIKDCLTECSVLFEVYKSMPKFTKDEFEKAEHNYWTKRLVKDAELSVLATGRIESGIAQSLLQIGVNPIQLQVQIDQAQHLQIEHYNSLLLEKKDEKNA